MVRTTTVKLFNVISHAWRHVGAILCFWDSVTWLTISSLLKVNSTIPLVDINFRSISIAPLRSWPCTRIDARVRARQNLKMLKIQLWSILHTFQTILNISKISARTRPRVHFCARSTYESYKFRFFTWFGFLIQHLAISIHFQSLSTDNKVIRVRQSSKSARAPIGKYSEKWWYCLLSRSSSECRVTPTFYYMVGKLMSCRYDIRRQNGWSDVVTSSYGRFNSKIWFLICDVINFCIHFSVSRLSFVKFLPNFSML